MDQPEDLYDSVCPQPANDQVPRCGNSTPRLDTAPPEPKGVCVNAPETGNLNRPDHAWLLAERGHDRQDQPAIPTGRLHAVLSRAIKENSIDLVFRRSGQPIDQLAAGGQASL